MCSFAICLLLNHFFCSVSFRNESCRDVSEIYSQASSIIWRTSFACQCGWLWLRFQSQSEDHLVPDKKTERALYIPSACNKYLGFYSHMQHEKVLTLHLLWLKNVSIVLVQSSSMIKVNFITDMVSREFVTATIIKKRMSISITL